MLFALYLLPIVHLALRYSVGTGLIAGLIGAVLYGIAALVGTGGGSTAGDYAVLACKVCCCCLFRS
ncbi:MAG: hypothetical protein HC893_08410 [Chloroflexaceae bacterium]|nr:hypothetical protein [Chloroflexaceae bacterium]